MTCGSEGTTLNSYPSRPSESDQHSLEEAFLSLALGTVMQYHVDHDRVKAGEKSLLGVQSLAKVFIQARNGSEKLDGFACFKSTSSQCNIAYLSKYAIHALSGLQSIRRAETPMSA